MHNTKSQRELCIYCLERAATSRDHIPPKNLFPKPRPSNLITVPSCGSCNLETSKDDEYFRLITVMRDDAHEHLSAKLAWKRAYRSLQRGLRRNPKSKILETFKRVEVFTPGGIYLGDRTVFSVDYPRVALILKKIIKGLTYAVRKAPLPKEYWANVFVLEGFKAEFWERPDLTKWIDLLLRQEAHIIGDNIFSYRYKVAEGDEFSAIWLLEFYGYYPVVGFTSPQVVHNTALQPTTANGGG